MEKERVRDEPEVYQNQIDIYLKMFCEENEIENMKKESQSVWNAALMYIQHHVFNTGIPGRMRCGNRYDDADVLMAICEYYIFLCYLHDKEVSLRGFCKLTGINEDTLFTWKTKEYRGSSTKHSELYKKLNLEREESLSSKLATANKNPIGTLAILNHWYGWNMQPVVQERTQLVSRSPEEIQAQYGTQIECNGQMPELPD